MGLFSANPARREARLERQIGRKETKLEQVRKQIPGHTAAAALAPKFNNPAQSNQQALAELKDYVVELDRKQQEQIDALDDDIGRAVQKLKRSTGGGSAFGGDMSGLMLVLLLGGGLGGSSTTTTSSSSTTTTLLLLMLLGGGDSDGGMGGMMGLILLLALL